MEKYIEDISELNLAEEINRGSCSSIYRLDSLLLFKFFNEDYRDLSDSINLEFLDTISTISSISDLHFVARGIDVYRSSSELFGYTMKEINASKLDEVSDDALVFDIILGFEKLKTDIRRLSDNYVKTEDIGGDNILYNGNMYLLDLDLSLVNKGYVPDELYFLTRQNVFRCVFDRITGCKFKDMVSNDDYFEYCNKIIDFTANAVGYYPKTVSEFKGAYQKTIGLQ